MDNLADMLIQVKNAGNAGKESVSVPYSNFKYAVAEKLLRSGYIASVNKKAKKGFKVIEIEIAYDEDIPRVRGLERISKLSRRVYLGVSDIQPVRQGFGSLFLSTPKGIMTGKDAVKEKVGGEALFKIW